MRGQKRILTLSLDVGDLGRLKGRLPAQQEVSDRMRQAWGFLMSTRKSGSLHTQNPDLKPPSAMAGHLRALGAGSWALGHLLQKDTER